MLITALLPIRPEGHQESRNEVQSWSPADRLVGFEPKTFRFWLQRLNPLGHFPVNLEKQIEKLDWLFFVFCLGSRVWIFVKLQIRVILEFKDWMESRYVLPNKKKQSLRLLKLTSKNMSSCL